MRPRTSVRYLQNGLPRITFCDNSTNPFYYCICLSDMYDYKNMHVKEMKVQYKSRFALGSVLADEFGFLEGCLALLDQGALVVNDSDILLRQVLDRLVFDLP